MSYFFFFLEERYIFIVFSFFCGGASSVSLVFFIFIFEIMLRRLPGETRGQCG
jgi:hypothetical protein